MKLVIISHTPHYRAAEGHASHAGQIAGWGPTIREIDHLASLFDEVVHIAPLEDGPAPPIALPYTSPRVTFRPVLPAGGERFIDKVDILLKAPHYLRVMLEELRDADAVHVRCSAAISLFANILLGLVHYPAIRWVKYAGDWKPEYHDTWANRMQRWWISRRLHRGLVTINGQWPDQPTHIYSFVRPCLTAGELAEGRAVAQGKQLADPLRVLFVGRTELHKGLDTALTVIKRLCDQGVAATLDIVGGGPDRALFEA